LRRIIQGVVGENPLILVNLELEPIYANIGETNETKTIKLVLI